MKTKICTGICKLEKPETEQFFYFRKDSNSYRNECKICFNEKNKKYYIDYKEQILLKVEKYQKENKIYIKQKRKNRYLKNRDKVIDKSKNWYQNNKEKKKSYDKKYRIENKEKILVKDVKRRRKMRKENIQIRIRDILSSRINSALRGNTKSLNTMMLIGCEIDYFLYHIQNQFTEGMDWENYGKGYGKWNMDHIKPCCKFDLSKELEQLECFNYKNIQPLWFEDNLSKGSK